MRLAEYLAARGESENKFARRAGVPQTTLSRAARGAAVPGGRIAAKIIAASQAQPTPCGGSVTLEDLVAACEPSRSESAA